MAGGNSLPSNRKWRGRSKNRWFPVKSILFITRPINVEHNIIITLNLQYVCYSTAWWIKNFIFIYFLFFIFTNVRGEREPAVGKYGTSRFLIKQQLYEVAWSLRALTGTGSGEISENIHAYGNLPSQWNKNLRIDRNFYKHVILNSNSTLQFHQNFPVHSLL